MKANSADDATHRTGTMDFAFIAERRIQEAMVAGAFDNLPGMGQPIPDLDQPYDELWWVRKLIEREGLAETPGMRAAAAGAGLGYDWVRRLPAEADVRHKVRLLNARIRRANVLDYRNSGEVQPLVDEKAAVRTWRGRRRAGCSV